MMGSEMVSDIESHGPPEANDDLKEEYYGKSGA
jgi:hypothetical protein